DLSLGDALAWLDAHTNLERGGSPRPPTLDRMRPLVELLGSPQTDYQVVHVTGTNGKTTTTNLVASLLAAQGLSVGAYTSPHLEVVNERIAWARGPSPGGPPEPIADAALAEALTAVAAVEGLVPEPPSYFEILTAAAYRFFADSAVDVAVVEVGLGGTWDATNVADGVVAVITNVSLDHTEYLGPTRADIAAEKAGIVKPGATLVLGEDDPHLEPLFLDRSPGRVLRRGEDFAASEIRLALGGHLVDLRTPGRDYPGIYLPIHGAFQVDNAALALAAAESFFDGPLDREVVAEAFAAFRSPGRLEVVAHSPLVILDGAHNVAGAEAMVAALSEEFTAAPRILVVGLLREKDPALMLAALGADSAQRLIVAPPPTPRALDPGEVAAVARDELGITGVEVAPSVTEALRWAVEGAGPDDQVVVTGSLYAVGEARASLK
ncbi:MAG: bifunctional folylpolyglutamate synthase/dihydrofolate synthase, partial [Acidimicrobiia bacterium]